MIAFCDLELCPVSYDFLVWLVRAQQQSGGRLHVVFVPHEGGLGGFARHWGPHDEAATRWRFQNILMPACSLVGATLTVAPSRVFAEAMRLSELEGYRGVWWPQGRAHLMGPLVASARAGEKVPRLRASEQARRIVRGWGLGDFVTMTLRSQHNDISRNAVVSEWERMRSFLELEGWRVLWLNDTMSELKTPSGLFSTLSIDLRLALYEQAAMNICGMNGPCALLHLSKAPYLNVGFGESQVDRDWLHNHGIREGEQLPWAEADQRLTWLPATFDGMREAWEKWRVRG